jgi:hypothetical protein
VERAVFCIGWEIAMPLLIGPEQPVNTDASGSQGSPRITGFQDGGWLTSWVSHGPDGAGQGVYRQPYTSQDAEDRILYDRATGSVFYDPDGTGSAVAVRFAVVATKKALTHHDFLVT